MPFDPSLPANHAPLVSQVMREQLVALFALIQSIPDGPQGPQGIPGNDGAQGPPFAQAIIDAVNTLNPGDAASVSVSFDGTNVHFTFGIPRGFTGNDGPQGSPFTNFVIDGVTTLNPGDNATVQASFDGSAVRLSFGIPRGFTGNDGPQGIQGPSGEVTAAQLADGITAALVSATANSSANSNGVPLLNLTVSGPPAQAEVQAIADKLDALITALRR